MSLSIPRRILVDDEGLHILCLLDITELHPEEIASVRQVEKQELRGYVPYFGGYGFFGFYGHYFDLKNLERVKIYASEWRNFVEITDIYENRIYVSCTQGEELVKRPTGTHLARPRTTSTGATVPGNDGNTIVSTFRRQNKRHRPLHFSPLSNLSEGISIHYLPKRMLCCVYQYLHVKG